MLVRRGHSFHDACWAIEEELSSKIPPFMLFGLNIGVLFESFIHSLIHSRNIVRVRSMYVPGIVLEAGDAVGKKTSLSPALGA